MNEIGKDILSPEKMETFYNSIKYVGNLVQDPTCFMLIGLVTLLNYNMDDNDRAGHSSHALQTIVNLKLTFLRLLKRRLRAGGFHAFTNYDSFDLALRQVHNLAEVIGTFLDPFRRSLQFT